MIDGAADGIRSASIYARVATALVEAGSIGSTVVVNNTLWICTFSSAIDNMAEAVRSTWRWITGLNYGVGWLAGGERITNHVVDARAYRAVIDGVALGTIPAYSRTWISTFIVDTGFVS